MLLPSPDWVSWVTAILALGALIIFASTREFFVKHGLAPGFYLCVLGWTLLVIRMFIGLVHTESAPAMHGALGLLFLSAGTILIGLRRQS